MSWNPLRTSKYRRKAKEAIEHLLELNPKDGRGYLLKAAFTEDTNKKEKFVDQALALGAYDPQTYEAKYGLLLEQRKVQEALVFLEKEIDLLARSGRDPARLNYKRLYLVRYFYLGWLRDEEKAVQLIEDADRTGLKKGNYEYLLHLIDYAKVERNKKLRSVLKRIFYDPRYKSFYEDRKYNIDGALPT